MENSVFRTATSALFINEYSECITYSFNFVGVEDLHGSREEKMKNVRGRMKIENG